MHRPLLVVLVVLLMGYAHAESRLVNVLDEMQTASLVAEVRVVSYSGGRLHGTMVAPPQRAIALKCSADGTWAPSPHEVNPDIHSIQTGQWPAIGQQVLVVADSHRQVSLFARPEGADWHFWSPWATGSVAMFRLEESVRPLGATPPDADGSWDGCLLGKPEVSRYTTSAHTIFVTLNNTTGQDLQCQVCQDGGETRQDWINVAAGANISLAARPGEFLYVRYNGLGGAALESVAAAMQVQSTQTLLIVNQHLEGSVMDVPSYRTPSDVMRP